MIETRTINTMGQAEWGKTVTEGDPKSERQEGT